jgi:hypothetical protein|tara:strand:+ start:1079 stop:1729 length:651 start_codon:yes stop_codon:yes gene_type:complete
MRELNINHIPMIIDTVFYRYNYFDYRMWAQIRNQLEYREVGDNSIIISSKQLKEFMAMNYASEINKVASYGLYVPKKDATSIYFMHRLTTEMINLKYIKLTLDSDKSYTRIVKTLEDEVIKYDYAILKARLDISEIFPEPELQLINAILEELELLKPGVPYFNGLSDDILNKLSRYLDTFEDEMRIECQLIAALLDAIDISLDSENPMLLIITDYS